MNARFLPPALALIAAAMVGLAACSTTPRPPPEFHVTVTHTPAERTAAPSLGAIVVGPFEDARGLADPLRIGEVHAPGYNSVPITGPPRQAAIIGGSLQLLYLATPGPTGWYVYVKGAAGLAPPLERALREALNRSGYPSATQGPLRLEGTIRSFWLSPSWTTRCDAEIALRLIDENGSAVWTKVVVAHAEKFVGIFGDEAFENVVRIAVDDLIARAAAEFASSAFAAAVSRTSVGK